ncbi:hypothetical protein ACQKP0_11875 [Heyndrickxia sp. NPDC080065]|uniref:hypothetical protein n=1 Tax=Heyndrickxia sp. NPDC080065 TaxID=3390568 RepID=UPI003CFDEE58
MSNNWEEAIIQKIDELLYEIVLGEEKRIHNPRVQLMLLYLKMRITYQKEEEYNYNEEELKILLHEIKEFQEEHKNGFQKILRETP